MLDIKVVDKLDVMMVDKKASKKALTLEHWLVDLMEV